MESKPTAVGEAAEKQCSSYRYWVRNRSEDAAPLPVPRKLTPQEQEQDMEPPPSSLGSVWNKAGTWEEKNLNSWAIARIKTQETKKRLNTSKRSQKGTRQPISQSRFLGAEDFLFYFIYFLELMPAIVLEFSGGKAEIAEVSKCIGDAFLVTVRNKKRVGYTYELTLKFKGEWLIQEEKKKINGHIDIPEFSFGELDDLQVDVRLSDEKDLVQQFKAQIKQDMNMFLHPIRERLLQFEQELKER